MAARSGRVEGASRPARWLFGPIPDLLFGCGVAYLAVFVGLAVVGPDVTRWLPASILPLLTVVAGGPHYGPGTRRRGCTEPKCGRARAGSTLPSLWLRLRRPTSRNSSML